MVHVCNIFLCFCAAAVEVIAVAVKVVVTKTSYVKCCALFVMCSKLGLFLDGLFHLRGVCKLSILLAGFPQVH